MIVAVDAMGGDYAPAEIIKGALQGSKLYGVDVVLVGDEDVIKRHLPNWAKCASGSVSIKHASEAIGMDEHVEAVRTKRDASVVVCACLVKERKADAMVTMGNTGAAMAAATLKLDRITGIHRPALAAPMPSKSGSTLLLDVGAVVDCSAENLRQFALMGSIYAQKVLSIKSPRVGLLSVGEEKSKGNKVTLAAQEALAAAAINFIGNVEGRDAFSGIADIVVTDGFVGNAVLKAAEGLAEYIRWVVRDDICSHPLMWIPLAMLLGGAKRLKRKLDYSEYGGAPLLGVDGVCIIGHGRSKARALANAIRAAREAVSGGLVTAIRDALTDSSKLEVPVS